MLTLAVPLTSHLNDVYAGVDHIALSSLMAKKGKIVLYKCNNTGKLTLNRN